MPRTLTLLSAPIPRTFFICWAVLLGLNLAFLAVRLADNLVAKPIVEKELRVGFANGSMSTISYPENMLTGRDQYSDCITAQLAVLGGRDALHDAIAPRLLHVEQVGPDGQPIAYQACDELKRYVEGADRRIPDATYTRFWQGGASILALGLSFLPVDGYRGLLLNLSLGLIAITAVLAARAPPPLLTALAPLLVLSFFFGGQVGYAQLFSYGPPQIAMWAIAAGMIALRNRLTLQRVMPIAVAAGALEAFFDQIISVPLAAIVFALVAGFILQANIGPQRARDAATTMVLLFGAWIFGFAGSYAIKLLISAALLGWSPIHDFVTQLLFRTGTVDAKFGFGPERHTSRFVMLGSNVVSLLGNSWRLGYTSRNSEVVGCLVVAAVMMAGWVAALRTLLTLPREARARFVAAGMPYIAAAVFLAFWVIALPEHTIRHAFFMVRSAIPWLAGGWGWIFAAHGWAQHRDAGQNGG